MKIQSIVSAIGLLALLFATSSHATATYSLSSSATLDLNAMSYTTVSGDAIFLPSFGTAVTDATVTANGHFNNDPSSAALNINELGGSVVASANITPLDVLGSRVDVNNNGSGTAVSEYILDYTIAGTGQIEVSMPFSLTIDPESAPTTGNSVAAAFLYINNPSLTVEDGFLMDWQPSYGDNGLIDGTIWVDIVLDVSDGDAGSLIFSVEAESKLIAPVPIPPAGFLMLSSLFGLSFGACRRAK